MRRGLACLALVLTALGLAAGVVWFVDMASAESAAARAVDGALVLIDLFALTATSLLIWPRRG